jgi:hypothetical protein
MSETCLCLTLFNGQLRALAVNRGRPGGSWQAPEPVDDFIEFGSVLKEAVKQTKYEGGNVALVAAHPRLVCSLVETPPIKGRNLQRFLARRVRQLKTFGTEAASSFQTTVPTKNASGVVLHYFPKPFLDELAQGCVQADLRLTKVFPVSAILARHLGELPLQPDEVALLAAETNGAINVVIGGKDGRIYLARSINSSWNTHPDRVNVDLNRTILYVRQHFGVIVNSVWLLGEGAEKQISAVQEAVKLVANVIPVPGPFHWNQGVLGLAPDDTSNLVSTEQLQAPQRRLFLRVTSVVIGALALAALITAGVIQALAKDRARQIEKLRPRIEALVARRAQLQQREEIFQQQRDFVKVVSEQEVKPVPGWFLGYLGDHVPSNLLLTHVSLKRADDLWWVEISGTLQPGVASATNAPLTEAVRTLATTLVKGPFHVKVTDDTPAGGAPKAGESSSPIGVRFGKENEFTIVGVMR